MAELDPLGPVLGVLFEDGSSDYILKVLGLSGVPAHFELSAAELYGHSTRKRAYRSRLGQLLTKFSEPQRIRVGENIAEEVGSNDHTRSRTESVLRNVGWVVSEGRLSPIPQGEAIAGASLEGRGPSHGLDSSEAGPARVSLEKNVDAIRMSRGPVSDVAPFNRFGSTREREQRRHIAAR